MPRPPAVAARGFNGNPSLSFPAGPTTVRFFQTVDDLRTEPRWLERLERLDGWSGWSG